MQPKGIIESTLVVSLLVASLICGSFIGYLAASITIGFLCFLAYLVGLPLALVLVRIRYRSFRMDNIFEVIITVFMPIMLSPILFLFWEISKENLEINIGFARLCAFTLVAQALVAYVTLKVARIVQKRLG